MIPISLFLRISIIVIMEQYILWPLSLRKPPTIFCLFLAFRKSLSEMLSSNGTQKSCKNKRWLWLYFSILLSNVFLSVLHIYEPFFCFLPALFSSYFIFISVGSVEFPYFMNSFRFLFLSHKSVIISSDHRFCVSSVFLHG